MQLGIVSPDHETPETGRSVLCRLLLSLLDVACLHGARQMKQCADRLA